MRSRGAAVVAGVVVSVFVALRVLAFADSPDPSWIGGLWDDDDYDNVILFLTSELDLLATAHRLVVQAFATVAGSVFEHPPWVVTPHAYAPGTPRAPPASGEVA